MKLIVAVDKNWQIGCNGGLLFKLPEDMKFFRETTKSKVVVMGRSTLESMPEGKPLKNRTNIVLSRNTNYQAEGCITCHSLDELFGYINQYETDDVYVIGGGQIYAKLMPYCTEAIITKVNSQANADTYLPNFDENVNWKLEYVSEERFEEDISFRFTRYKNLNVEKFKL